jgi:hypothetical protein
VAPAIRRGLGGGMQMVRGRARHSRRAYLITRLNQWLFIHGSERPQCNKRRSSWDNADQLATLEKFGMM